MLSEKYFFLFSKILMTVIVSLHFFLLNSFMNRLQKKSGTYAPHNKGWIKEQIYSMLRRQAGK